MSSLRSRLTLAAAVVAVVPLVAAMALLGRRLQQGVDAEAAGRLDASLGSIENQIRAEADRLAGRLEVAAGDPRLARLLLDPAAGPDGVAVHLAEQQYLLGLDYLGLVRPGGQVVADAALAPDSLRRSDRAPLRLEAVAGDAAAGVAIVRSGAGLALDAAFPVRSRSGGGALVRGGIALDSVRLGQLERTAGVDLVLTDGGGSAIASTIVGGAEVAASGAAGRVVFDGRSYIVRRVPIRIGPGPHPVLAGFVSTAAADETIAGLWRATLLVALTGVALAVALGFLLSRAVSRPVERLAAFSDRISRGEWEEPLAMESVRELATLVGALERMRAELRTTQDRIRAGERQAAYGQMARLVAHEIKNPLTPIAVSVADLRRAHEERRPDFAQTLDQAVRIIGEEIHALQRLIQEFSDFGRLPSPQFAPLDLAAVLGELEALHSAESRAGRLAVEPPSGPLAMEGDRAQLRQALLNLIQNGLDAAGPGGRVTARARAVDGRVEIEVSDNGPGLPPRQAAGGFVPGFTTKTHGSGLGLAIVERIVTEHGGTIAVETAAGRGTTFLIRLPAGRRA